VTGRTRREENSSVRIVDSAPPLALYEDGPTDLMRLVDAIVGAHLDSGHDPAWCPWPDPLPERVTLDEIESSAVTTIEGGVVLGLVDLPHEQRHEIARWIPSNGPLLVQSLRGGGATTALAAIALDVARCHAPDRAHIYVLDLARENSRRSRELPHCGAYIAAHETERIARLLRLLTDELKARKASPSPTRATPDDRRRRGRRRRARAARRARHASRRAASIDRRRCRGRHPPCAVDRSRRCARACDRRPDRAARAVANGRSRRTTR
jgi:hypothetical protein